MAEYIERTEDLILAVNAGARVIENTKRYHGASYCIDVFSADHKEIPYLKAAEVLRGFDGIPAADVAPVRHGRIVGSLEDGRYRRRFSCCGEDATMITQWAWPKYCPNCGAKVDG